MAKETVLAREIHPQSQNIEQSGNSMRSRIASAFSSLSADNDTRINFSNGSVILEEREARDFSRTDEPWIVAGAHTLFAEFPRQDVTLRYTYTQDKETARRLGLYATRRAALSQMRKDVTQRIKTLEKNRR